MESLHQGLEALLVVRALAVVCAPGRPRLARVELSESVALDAHPAALALFVVPPGAPLWCHLAALLVALRAANAGLDLADAVKVWLAAVPVSFTSDSNSDAARVLEVSVGATLFARPAVLLAFTHWGKVEATVS